MSRRLAYRSTNLPIWVAFAIALLLFVIAMALAWWRMGNYDASATRADASAQSTVTPLTR